MRYRGRTIRAEFGEPVTIIRTGVGEYDDNGEWVSGDETRSESRAASAALSGQELTKLRYLENSGYRLQDIRRFWLVEDDLEALVEGESEGDLLIWDGTTFRLIEKRKWLASGGFAGYLGVKEEDRGAVV